MIILYPTDTLYGLGVDATDPAAIRELQTLKGRPDGKAISIVVANQAMMEQYAEVTPLAQRLIEKFLPGKLTIILNSKNLPTELSPDGTIGVRIPDHPIPLSLVTELGKPITATSANISGEPTLNSPNEILAQFGDRAHMITKVIDAGPLPSSPPSTIVDARGNTPIILRHGAISDEAILEI